MAVIQPIEPVTSGFQQADFIPNNDQIRDSGIGLARNLWQLGQYDKAWAVLANNGDGYDQVGIGVGPR